MEKERIVVVGVNHAGTSFIRTLRAFDKESEVIAFDRNDNISFLGCGIALWVDGTVKNPKDLFYANKDILTAKNVDVRMKHDVVSIDTDKKVVHVRDLDTGKEFEEKYTKLVYAGGSWPRCFNLENGDLQGIHICKIYQHAEKIIAETKMDDVKSVAVVGAGYIGAELVEAFHKLGKKVTLIDIINQPVGNYFDVEFTQPLIESMEKAGVNIRLGEKVVGYEGDTRVRKVKTDKGEYDADMVIMCCGFIPNTQMLPKAEKIENGAIKVDENNRAYGLEDVYVLGDSAALYNAALKKHAHVALATNAVKTGVAAAGHVVGVEQVKLRSVTGTNGLCIFSHKLASTGITEEVAKRHGMEVGTAYFKDADRPEFMQEYGEVALKIVYEKETFRLVGAQIDSYGKDNHSEIMFYLSLAIQKEINLFELALTDVYFLPHYNKPFNFVLSTILKALNVNL